MKYLLAGIQSNQTNQTNKQKYFKDENRPLLNGIQSVYRKPVERIFTLHTIKTRPKHSAAVIFEHLNQSAENVLLYIKIYLYI